MPTSSTPAPSHDSQRPPARVEREVPLAEAPRPGLGGGGEEVAEWIEGAGVGGGVGAGRAADRLGVHGDDARERASAGAAVSTAASRSEVLPAPETPVTTLRARGSDAKRDVRRRCGGRGPRGRRRPSPAPAVPGARRPRSRRPSRGRLAEEPAPRRRVRPVRAEELRPGGPRRAAGRRRPRAGTEVDEPVGGPGEDAGRGRPPPRSGRGRAGGAGRRAAAPMSCGWRPALGSSRTTTSPRSSPRARESRRRRRASPGERVGAARSKRQVPEAELLHQRAAGEEVRADRREDAAPPSVDAVEEATQLAGRQRRERRRSSSRATSPRAPRVSGAPRRRRGRGSTGRSGGSSRSACRGGSPPSPGGGRGSAPPPAGGR